LNGALQRPRTIHRIEARLADLVARIVVQPQRDIALRQPLPQRPNWMSTMERICSRPSEWNTTMSSTRLMNSGRKCCVTTCMTAAFIFA
jgi:hypothetical protein